jgi:hypothetical protein
MAEAVEERGEIYARLKLGKTVPRTTFLHS